MEKIATPVVAKAPAILLLIAKWIVLLPFFGLLYAYMQWYVQIFPLVPLFPLGIAYLAVALISRDMVKAGLPQPATWLGLLSGAIVLYFAWAVWLNLVENFSHIADLGLKFKVSHTSIPGTIALLKNPGEMMILMDTVNKFGTWGLEGWTANGILLWICWLLEVLIVLWVAGEAISDKMLNEVFVPKTIGSTHSSPGEH